MKTKALFNLAEVSPHRREFLHNWHRERNIDLTLRSSGDSSDTIPAPASAGVSQAWDGSFVPRPYDVTISSAEVRLLGPGSTADPSRLAYMAVLDIYFDQGIALVAPFSPYSNPGTRGEWLTPLESSPLRVLQLWNALPVPLFALARSWRCCSLTKDELNNARELYRHTVAGTWPAPSLREQTGLAIHSPDDERITYQNEEMALYAPLRSALFNLQDLMENPPVMGSSDFNGLWNQSESGASSDAFAADSGGFYVKVILQSMQGEAVKGFRACRLNHINLGTGEWESRWEVENWGDARPYLPVFACIDGEQGAELIASTSTGGSGGTVLLFKGDDPVVFERLGSPDLYLIIREV